MKYGLGKGWMGILFAVLMIITFGFAYNSVQSNTICLAWQKALSLYYGITSYNESGVVSSVERIAV